MMFSQMWMSVSVEIVHTTAIRIFLVPLCVLVEMVSSSLLMQELVLVSYKHSHHLLVTH